MSRVCTRSADHSPPPRAHRSAWSVLTVTHPLGMLRAARIPAGTDRTWERGTPEGWLAGLIADWQVFDPFALQARLDQLLHLRVVVDGITVHVVYAPGTGPDPLPLLLTHGWPSSFLEYLKLLPLLTDPAGHGGAEADAFSVVAPSLPGFGFSGPPPAHGPFYLPKSSGRSRT